MNDLVSFPNSHCTINHTNVEELGEPGHVYYFEPDQGLLPFQTFLANSVDCTTSCINYAGSKLYSIYESIVAGAVHINELTAEIAV